VAAKTRFIADAELRADRLASDFKRVSDEILAPLTNVSGATVRITVSIEANAPEGFDESTVRTVSENAATLKLTRPEFIEE
jgi:hypothetical protein